ncbi:hypothetical protein VC83_09525 [Pseudogymnoascus destructans]|uniref:Uncharacterized protein n=1 Tax=Pseudogymnoascus destructans TaxID=655981 RepID=A0A176ZY03_9PEZI|nr:uncharacterized protein VC83_09525 [Pseudogymnoascus destructans]OAF54170.1 hypothetical protein VC83_09525 [Pseudogymnoascus destructans]
MKQHGNKVHSKQRVADEDLFQARAVYSHGSMKGGHGEDSDAGDGLDSGSDGGGHMVDDQIIQDIEKWRPTSKSGGCIFRGRPEEPKLERLLRAWKRIMERCLDTLEDIDHKDVLKWWASPKNEAASQRPFELPQSTKSMDKYSRVWEGFICYMMRTATGDWGEDSETGVGVHVCTVEVHSTDTEGVG